MGQAKWDRKMMASRSEMPQQTATTGLPVHDCQFRTARTGQDFNVDMPRQIFQDFRDRRARADYALIQH